VRRKRRDAQRVRPLKPGDSVGCTPRAERRVAGDLHGQGDALIEGEPGDPSRRRGLLRPSGHAHNVKNTGGDVLEYVYVVAPAKGRSDGPNQAQRARQHFRLERQRPHRLAVEFQRRAGSVSARTRAARQ